jgi:hypothetical protein
VKDEKPLRGAKDDLSGEFECHVLTVHAGGEQAAPE